VERVPICGHVALIIALTTPLDVLGTCMCYQNKDQLGLGLLVLCPDFALKVLKCVQLQFSLISVSLNACTIF